MHVFLVSAEGCRGLFVRPLSQIAAAGFEQPRRPFLADSRPPIEVKGPLYTPLLTVGLRLLAGGTLGSPQVMKPFFTMRPPVERRDASGETILLAVLRIA